MAYPTITGFGPSANSAYTSALVEFSGTYGGCPSGLVGIPDSGTSGSSGIYDGSTYRHEITPTGGSVFFGFSGYSPSVLKQQWEFNVNSITGGSPSCPTCAQVTSGVNWGTDSAEYDITYPSNLYFYVEADIKARAAGFSGLAGTGDLYSHRDTIATSTSISELSSIGDGVCGYGYQDLDDQSFFGGEHFDIDDDGSHPHTSTLVGLTKLYIDQDTYEWKILWDIGDSSFHNANLTFADSNWSSVTDGCDSPYVMTGASGNGLNREALRVSIGLGEYANDSDGNWVLPKQTGSIAGSWTLVPFLKHESSSTCSTYPDSGNNYCDFGGSARTAIWTYHISDLKITATPY